MCQALILLVKLLVTLAAGIVALSWPSFFQGSASANAATARPANDRKYCHVKADGKAGASSGDARAFLAALIDCDNGGHVVVNETRYTFAQPVEMLNLSSIDIELSGLVLFDNTFDYWQTAANKVSHHTNLSYIRLGGTSVSLYGNGTIDGRGQRFYDAYAKAPSSTTLQRPHLLTLDKLHNSRVAGLHLLNSPQRFVVVENSTDLTLEGLTLRAENGTNWAAANTDGFNIHRSTSITIRNSTVINGDDCVAVKANSTNIVVNDVSCRTLPGGSGGLTVGSIGQHPGVLEYVEDVVFQRCNVTGSLAALRIKTFPNGTLATKVSPYVGGGGHGHIKNVTWRGIFVDDVSLAVDVTQCYGTDGTEEARSQCPSLGSRIAIDGINFINVTGTTNATTWKVYTGSLQCSHALPCKGVDFHDVTITAQDNAKNVFACANDNEATSWMQGINCTANRLMNGPEDPDIFRR